MELRQWYICRDCDSILGLSFDGGRPPPVCGSPDHPEHPMEGPYLSPYDSQRELEHTAPPTYSPFPV